MKILLVDPGRPAIFAPQRELGMISLVQKYEDEYRKKLMESKIKEVRISDVMLRLGRNYDAPVGLLTIAAHLEKEGHNVSLICLDYLKAHHNNWKNKLISQIKESDVIGLAGITPTISRSIEIAKLAKSVNENITTVIGGVHVSFLWKDTLESYPWIDVVVRGEGEKTMVDLCRCIEKGKEFSSVAGIAFRGRKIIKTRKRPLLDLKREWIIPAYHLLPNSHANEFYISVEGSRGCVYSCLFCVESAFWKRYRTVSTEKLLQNISIVKEKFNTKLVYILDSIFPLSKKRTENFLNLKRFEKEDAFLICNVRPEFLSEELIKKMAKSGFVEFDVGIETLSDRTFFALDKAQTFDSIVKFSKMCNKYIPLLGSSWIMGLPNETKESIRENISRIRYLLERGYLAHVRPRFFTPLPGTEIFNYPEKYGIEILTYNWDRYMAWSYPPVSHPVNITIEELYNALMKTYFVLLDIYSKKVNKTQDVIYQLKKLGLPIAL